VNLLFKDGTCLSIDEFDHWSIENGWLFVHAQEDETVMAPMCCWNMSELKGFFDDRAGAPRITDTHHCLIQPWKDE